MKVAPVSGHFGGNVRGCSAGPNRFGHRQIDRLSPVHNKYLAKFTDHHVVGLQITVDDVAIMSKSDRVEYAFKDVQVFSARVLANRLMPGSAANPLHDVERVGLAFCVNGQANIVNRHDVGVFQASSKLGFSQEFVLHP